MPTSEPCREDCRPRRVAVRILEGSPLGAGQVYTSVHIASRAFTLETPKRLRRVSPKDPVSFEVTKAVRGKKRLKCTDLLANTTIRENLHTDLSGDNRRGRGYLRVGCAR